jgi:hypothetical protein
MRRMSDMQPTPNSLLVSFLLSGNRVVHDKIRLNENGEYELLPSVGAAAESTQPSFKSLPDLIDYYLANGERAGLGYSLIDSNPIYDNHQLIQERTGALVKKSFEQEPAVAPKRTIYDENPIRSDGAMANATFVDPPPPPRHSQIGRLCCARLLLIICTAFSFSLSQTRPPLRLHVRTHDQHPSSSHIRSPLHLHIHTHVRPTGTLQSPASRATTVTSTSGSATTERTLTKPLASRTPTSDRRANSISSMLLECRACVLSTRCLWLSFHLSTRRRARVSPLLLAAALCAKHRRNVGVDACTFSTTQTSTQEPLAAAALS